ncbi:MAG: zinc ribbon domain-containing protein [Candidatus Hodarchaeales archaeon]|jgi:dipeptide/tripeptide permease
MMNDVIFGQMMDRNGWDFVWPLMFIGMAMCVVVFYLLYRFFFQMAAEEQPRPEAASSTAPTAREKGRICPNCGTKNTPDAQFCSQCAALL